MRLLLASLILALTPAVGAACDEGKELKAEISLIDGSKAVQFGFRMMGN